MIYIVKKIVLGSGLNTMFLKKIIGLLSVLTLTMFMFPESHTYAAASHEGQSPISTGCDDTAFTASSASIKNGSGTTIGTIYLRYSSNCQTAWAKVVFNSSMPSGYYGNAFIHKYNSDKSIKLKSYDCASSGGNGKVLPGQTSCYTPMVYDPAGYYARAEGYRITSSGNYQGALTGYY